MKLLFINAFKGLRKKKIQMLGIILMVALSTGIFTAMNLARERMEKSYYDYLENQKVEYLSVDVKVDFEKDITIEYLEQSLKTNMSDLTEEESQIIDMYKEYLTNKNNLFDNFSISYQLTNIFTKYNVLEEIQNHKLDNLKDKYNFVYEKEISKNFKEQDVYIKVIAYDDSKELNKPYLIEGKMPSSENEITVLPKFAENNNLKIGDSYKLGNQKYKIVGFAYAPDYIYPLVSYSALVFDEDKNNIVYMNKEELKEVNATKEETYGIYYTNGVNREFELSGSLEEGAFKLITEEETISMNPLTITRIGRIGAPQLEFKTNKLFASYFLYLLLGISTFVIVIVTKKRIEDEKLQIGVLKSLGYGPFSIAVSYLVYPIVGSLIGGTIGYLVGILCNGSLATSYLNFYLVPLKASSLNLQYLTYSLLVPILVLSILSYLISLFMLRKKPLELLKEGSNLKVNIFSKIVNKLTGFLPFKYRFKYNLAFRSIPKLIVVALTSFFTGLLIVLTLIGFNLINDLIEESFKGMNYNYMAYTISIESEKFDKEADYVLNAILNLKEINGQNVQDKSSTVMLTGIDVDSKYTEVIDENNKNITNLLDKKGIIISKNMQDFYEIKINDELVFSTGEENSQMIQYKVLGVNKGYMDMSAYVNREYLSKDFGFPKPVYSTIFSNNEKYATSDLEQEHLDKIATVIDFKDMKKNIEKSIQNYNSTIYIVIGFASVIAFVIVAVIANIVVEENKKTISLMKVMGYHNKKISSIVLNIYTPIIIISYFLSIPVMIALLKKIVSVLSDSIEMVIPISLDYKVALFGLVCLLVSYYVAVSLSKRVLNKIPLAIALKRE